MVGGTAEYIQLTDFMQPGPADKVQYARLARTMVQETFKHPYGMEFLGHMVSTLEDGFILTTGFSGSQRIEFMLKCWEQLMVEHGLPVGCPQCHSGGEIKFQFSF